MTMTFQSVSPSSIMARTPSTLTCRATAAELLATLPHDSDIAQAYRDNLAAGKCALANLTDIKRVVVALGVGARVHMRRVFPRLQAPYRVHQSQQTSNAIGRHRWSRMQYLREGTIVPNVALVGKCVSNEAQLAFLDILLDWCQVVLGADLYSHIERALHAALASASYSSLSATHTLNECL